MSAKSTLLTPAESVPALVTENLDVFACPACGAALELSVGGGLACRSGNHVFGCEAGIPRLFWPNEWTAKSDVTEMVKAFYEETPFPNYDDLDSPERLREKAEQGLFARLLNEQIPHGARILEAGCGTAQLTNFLGLTWGRTVFGSDMCLNSLKLGEAFRQTHGVPSACFLQMNLFRPAFRPGVFDVVVSNGVLHHTSDPFGGFQSILKCVRPGGHIVIGLYNRLGRLTTDLRRLIFGLTGDRLKSLDPRLRTAGINEVRKRAWFMDQYKHPHESKHTLDEVLGWFARSGVEFVNSIPKCSTTESFAADEQLFQPHSPGTALDRFLRQAGMLLTGGREGGFFIMIGRKTN